MIKRVAIGTLSLMLLDVMWLGVLMKSFYRQHLAPIAMTAPDGSLSPNWIAIAPVYLLIAIGLAKFVIPRTSSPASVALSGAVFGFVVFGVYDLTNFATLRDYSLTFTAVDMLWGFATCGITAVVMMTIGSAKSS